jgi:hypothetical protein
MVSNAGLLAYKNVNWDPTKQSTTSHQDYATQALVEEDLFQIGSNWKMDAPIIQPQANRDKRQPQQKNYTVENLLASCNTDTNIRSFGSAFGRHHDANSVASEKKTEEPTITVIQIDPTLVIGRFHNGENTRRITQRKIDQRRAPKRKSNLGSNAKRTNRRPFSQNYQIHYR